MLVRECLGFYSVKGRGICGCAVAYDVILSNFGSLREAMAVAGLRWRVSDCQQWRT